jgi:hypothetical protein
VVRRNRPYSSQHELSIVLVVLMMLLLQLQSAVWVQSV